LGDMRKVFDGPTRKISEGYKRVAKAAAEVGREREFASSNRLFSKMAHPTAFLVNLDKEKPFDRGFCSSLFVEGGALAMKCMGRLIDFLFETFPMLGITDEAIRCLLKILRRLEAEGICLGR